MGNCFGRPKDNFSAPGRSLNSSSGSAPKPISSPKPAPSTTSPRPPTTASYSPTPAQGRTVGGSDVPDSPRAAAARAAEARNKSIAGKGKLGKQLDAQKSLSNTELLSDASKHSRLARDADANTETRAWN